MERSSVSEEKKISEYYCKKCQAYFKTELGLRLHLKSGHLNFRDLLSFAYPDRD